MLDNNSPFSSVGFQLWEKGYSPIPIIPRCKIPGQYKNGIWKPMHGWDQYANRHPTEVEIQEWSRMPEAGVGVVLGKISNLVAVDFDYDIDGLHQIIRQEIPDSPVKKRGAKGWTSFYYYSGESNRTWSKSRKTVVELLTSTVSEDGSIKARQTVLPPTLHPEGREYAWLTTDDLLTVTDLPTLPPDFSARLDTLFEVSEPLILPCASLTRQSSGIFAPTTEPEVQRALTYIDPDADYHTWVGMGMAIKTEFGDGGFDLWDQWSAQGSKYKSKEMRSKWKSFKRHEKKIASVFYFAQKNGFAPKSNYSSRSSSQPIIILPGGNLSMLTKEVSVVCKRSALPENQFPLHLIENAPGLLGEISNWIIQTSIYPQPILALGAAIALLGVIKAHKVQHECGLRTSVYIMGVAESGSGKDHARQCVKKLLQACDCPLLLGGEPKSAAGLYKSLSDNKGRRLLLLDEFGKNLKISSTSQVSEHTQRILPLMMELFSSANGYFIGAEYANADNKRPRIDIDQPCLCVYATTVPDNLYSSLSKGDAIDGFLARWLIFESTDFPIEASSLNTSGAIPDSIINRLKYWQEQPTNSSPAGNLDFTISPRIIKYTSEAQEQASSFMKEARLRAWKEIELKSGLAPIFNRMYEHACKLSLIATEDGVIDVETFNWAAELSFFLCNYMASKIKNMIAENMYDGEYKKVWNIIHAHGHLTKTSLGQKTRFLSSVKRLDEIIQGLSDSEEIALFAIQNENAKKPTSSIFCNCDEHPDLASLRHEIEIEVAEQEKQNNL